MQDREHTILDAIEYNEQWGKARPPTHEFSLGIDDKDVALIGLIVAHWGALCRTVEVEIGMLRGHPNVPVSLTSREPRREMKRQIQHLDDLAAYNFDNTRDNATKLYRGNLSTIMRLKPIRDDLSHNSYDAEKNRESGVVHVHGKNGLKSFSHDKLLKTAVGISRCNSFFFDFRAWLSYEMQKTSLEALLRQMR